jgi:protein-S-isoprenylcysteine O-methyltransferase Ste14
MFRSLTLTYLSTMVVVSCTIAALGLVTRVNNHLGWVLLSLAGIFCIVGLFYLSLPKHRKSIEVELKNRSLWLLATGFLVILIIPPLEYLFLNSILPRSDFMQEVGLILFGAGLLFCFRSRIFLELWNPGDDQVQTDFRLTRRGTYQTTRYLDYAGYGLIALSLCMGYSSLIGLLAILGLLLPGIMYRMRIERTQEKTV